MLQRFDIPLENEDRQEIDEIRAIYRSLGGNDLEKRHLLRRFSTAGIKPESEAVSSSPEPPARRKTLTFDAITVDLIEEEVRKALHAVGGKGRHSASVVPGDVPGDYYAFDVLVAEVRSPLSTKTYRTAVRRTATSLLVRWRSRMGQRG